MKNNPSFDPLGRYYTQPVVSQALIDLINADPLAVADLGSGGGSLAAAAGKRWRNAEITTIDIDNNAILASKKHFNAPVARIHTHIVSDILRADLPTTVLGNKSFGVIVCNPPYVTADWNKAFGEILEDAGLSVLIKQDRKVSLEVLFLAQSLRLSDKEGLIALIVPDGLITGRTHQEFRRTISERHHIESIMQLPEGSFQGTQARAFIMVIAKQQNASKKTKLLKLRKDGSLYPTLFINNNGYGERLDYDYYASRKTDLFSYSLDDLDSDIRRGSLNSAQIREIKYSTFHTSDFDDKGRANIELGKRLSRTAQESGCIIAEKGDILLARVDRALHKKVALVGSGKAVLSDCIYRIRVAPALQKDLFTYLCSIEAEEYLSKASRGVGARMLPKHELLKMPLRMQSWPLLKTKHKM